MAKVVIVENDRLIARDLAEIIGALGHELAGTAATFCDGVALVECASPDLALIDIQIDGHRDGIALATELREEHPIAIAFITSHADQQTVARAATIRPNGYLIKPFDEASVGALVGTALSNHVALQHEIDGERIRRREQCEERSLSPVRQAKVIEYIDRNLDRGLKVEDLAGLCGMSGSEFSRQFHRATGATPYQFIKRERLKEAKRLLRNTDWTIADVALAVGFSNQSHFTSAFRNSEQATPLQYRRFAR